MRHDAVIRVAAICMLMLAALIVPAQQAKAREFIHAIVISDDEAPQVGSALQYAAHEFARLFKSNCPPDKYDVTPMGGRTVGPAAILQAIQQLPVVAGEDTIVVYTASHGGYDPRPGRGRYAYFPSREQILLRESIQAAILSKQPKLGVLISESCNHVNVFRRDAAPIKSFPAPKSGHLLPENFSPLFRSLFLSHVGFVDLASSQPGERSLCYPITLNTERETGKTYTRVRGTLFTDALVGAMSAHTQNAMTWSQLAAEIAPKVQLAFRRENPQGYEPPDEPENVQLTQTVDLISAGTWSPSRVDQSHAHARYRLGIRSQGNGGNGVRLVAVFPDSLAARMGLEPGDVILGINGERVGDIHEAGRLIEASGERITLDIQDVRTGAVLREAGDLDDARDVTAPPEPPHRPRFGAVAVEHTGTSGGLMVTHLVHDSPAERLQLEYGDIIYAINGQRINHQEGYHLAVRDSGRLLKLRIINVRDGQLQDFDVPLDF